MKAAHLHLMLNHIPVVASGIGVLILLAGYLYSNYAVKRTALAVFIFSAMVAIPAYLTGEGAEEIIEHIPGIHENTIEKHEEFGLIFLGGMILLGLLSSITMYIDVWQIKYRNSLYATVLVLSFIAVILAYEVAGSGGRIRHPEIDGTQMQQGVPANEEHERKE